MKAAACFYCIFSTYGLVVLLFVGIGLMIAHHLLKE